MKARLTCIASAALIAALFSISVRYLKDFWLLAFVNSFQLHIALAAGILSLICLLALRARIFAVLFVWSFLLGAHAIYMHHEFSTDGQFSESAKSFRLLSFNVLMENRANAESIADTILASNADVVYVMEAAALIDVLPRLQQTYPYRLGCGTGTPSCDLLMLSKRPLNDAKIGSLSYVSRDRIGIATIDFDGVPMTLAQAHLAKPYFDEYHNNELRRLSRTLNGTTGPLILGGDFNSASIVPDMRNFLQTTGLMKAEWEPATWPVEAGKFGIAIDHVFARKPATLVKLERLPEALGSNHYGLVADFMISAR
ncbi:endonuclease/exonuclease/phosphatase family protein [Agrobacterium larrymoorei]|uniref:Endonuclease/exonuclease/phosphatase family protein n=1 Tax=Agrobacterium larrymoorei TaxID=160699 RepID=A0AAF0KE62_9HYPH|nr:endonuclease/exonuclease/phosphatase family protein [Agrobacterium larrymoorei]WHA41980.1 endonuclease/exonuclease/phosphatase family protein [Agrobacterium larrymoorei]